MKKTTLWIGVTALVCFFLVTGIAEVTAKAVVDAYAGKFFVLKKKPPSYFRSQGVFKSFLKSNSTKIVHENKDHEWAFETMAFFKKPLGDYEVQIAFFDITKGASLNVRKYVTSYVQYTQDRNTRILFGKSILIRPDFDADRRYLVVARSRDQELARGDFKTRGISQKALDSQKRFEAEQKAMEKSMQDLERRAKEQEENRRKRKNQKAAEDLF
jgi:hypothetical protein